MTNEGKGIEISKKVVSELNQFDGDMIEKYGEVLPRLIENCDEIADADKEKIKANPKILKRKAVISDGFSF